MGTTFKDIGGNEWDLTITGATIKRALKLLGVDLGRLFDGDPPLLTRLATDIVFLIDVIYVICKSVADEREISDEEFGAFLGGEALLSADKALAVALVDFYQKLGKPAMVRAIEKQRLILAKAEERVVVVLESEEMDDAINGALSEIKVERHLAPGK